MSSLAKSHGHLLVMIQYQNFNFDTISIRYFTKYCDIDINILKKIISDSYTSKGSKRELEQGNMLYVGTKIM